MSISPTMTGAHHEGLTATGFGPSSGGGVEVRLARPRDLGTVQLLIVGSPHLDGVTQNVPGMSIPVLSLSVDA